MTIKPLSFIAALLIAVPPALAQVAYQGTPSTVTDSQRFTSPMVIENPFPAQSDWGKGQIRFVTPLSKFNCEGVTIRDLAISVGKARKGKLVTIRYDFILANEPGIDKKATIAIQLVRNGEPFGHAVMPWSEVEEGRITVRSVTRKVPADALLAEPAPTLRLIVQTRDDG